MVASKLSSCLEIAIVAAAMPTLSNRAYADDDGFCFSPFSSSSSSSSAPKDPSSSSKSEYEAEEPTGSGMDPEALESAAKALKEINNSKNSKQIFYVMRKQKQSRQTELSAEKAHFHAQQSHTLIERQRKMAEEQRNLVQQDAHRKAHVMQYEDEMARERMQRKHETQLSSTVSPRGESSHARVWGFLDPLI